MTVLEYDFVQNVIRKDIQPVSVPEDYQVPADNSSSSRKALHLITYPATELAPLHEKEVIINDKYKLVCLIDSGSSLNIMKKSTAERLDLQWTPNSTIVHGFGVNATTQVLGKATIQIKIDKETVEELIVHIVPDESHPRECLLGRQLCESSDIAFVKYKDRLEYYNNNEFPFSENPVLTNTNETCTLTVDGAIDLPAQHVTMVNALLVDKQV